ncbi:MAG: phospholipase family [Planctomycetota bacterium]|nr:MAG: phospholipase family [Planctomycetota bacterium]
MHSSPAFIPPDISVPIEFQIAFAILAAIELVLFLAAAAHAVMWRREPRAAADPHEACDPAARAALVGDLDPLAKLTDRISAEPLVDGNRIEPLWDGEEAFPAMLGAIAEAKQTVALCSYIFDCDATGLAFADALAAAASRGVKVKLLVDALGAGGIFSKLGRTLRRRRLKAASFDPLGFAPSRLVHFNLRNHRKILVVDGRVAFSGGINISARHLMADLKHPGRCRDVHFRMRGPVVAQAMRAFADDWHFAAEETLSGEAWFPALGHEGPTLARGIPSGPDQDLERIYWAITGAVTAARKSIHFVTPYFIPEQGLRHAIIAAALQGVDVRLFLPLETDNRVVAWATRAFLWEFLQAGVRVVYTPPPFDHSKIVLVDGRWALFGSANLDPRSLRLNFEYNVEAYDRNLCAALAAKYEALAEKGRKVTLADVDGRSMAVRIRDGVAKLFSPYL